MPKLGPHIQLLEPDDPRAPKYWKNETSDLPAIIAEYLQREYLTDKKIARIKAYLKQWIDSPVWKGPAIEALRTQVNLIQTRLDIDHWIHDAVNEGIDPL